MALSHCLACRKGTLDGVSVVGFPSLTNKPECLVDPPWRPQPDCPDALRHKFRFSSEEVFNPHEQSIPISFRRLVGCVGGATISRGDQPDIIFYDLKYLLVKVLSVDVCQCCYPLFGVVPSISQDIYLIHREQLE